ncbi:hypothetical protein [Piscinibacter sakaiensis]|uniref:hypothetical protein n=1 Tax=Piscinibacter sakaiensis TaxID=1547922 RepID=UPI003AAE3AF6
MDKDGIVPPPDIVEHVHPLPVCGFGAHSPHAPHCAGLGRLVACGQVVDPQHPAYGNALCWHRRPDAPAGGAPPLAATPDATSPPATAGTTASAGGPTATSGPGSGTGSAAGGGGDVSSGNGDGAGAVSSTPSTPLPPTDPLTEPDWCWWLKYFWLVPLLLLMLVLLGLLYKLLKWLGIFGLLKELVAALWELLKEFLRGRLRTVPDPPPQTEPVQPPPTEDAPHDSTDDAEEDEEEREHACELNGEPSITLHPAGWVIAAPDCLPGMIHLVHAFEMAAGFRGHCHCCEYSQEIKGEIHVRRRGREQWEKLDMVIAGGALLDANEYRLDGKPGFAYGRRNGQKNIREDSYLPVRGSGCRYRGEDLPGVRDLSLGDTVRIRLMFRGRVIDRCTGLIKWEKEWTLRTRGQIDLDMHFPYTGTSTYTYKKQY